MFNGHETVVVLLLWYYDTDPLIEVKELFIKELY